MSSDDRSSKHLYFMGICGTAMGSVAVAFREAGYRVSGSDKGMYDPMKGFLESRGIGTFEGYRAENLPDDVDYFIIGNAQSRGNPEVEAVLDRKLPYLSLPELLRNFVLRGRHNYVVTGTHGKTTTASLVAWVFECGGLTPNFVIGGLPGNFEQGARITGSDHVVLEGDEYDSAFFDKRSKFIHYMPEVAIVNNMEFDHADIFDDIHAVRKTFGHMMRLVPGNGLLLINGDDRNCREMAEKEAHCPVRKVGFGPECDATISDVVYSAEGSDFSLLGERYHIPLIGEFNVRNGAMAVCAGLQAGLQPGTIREALASFKGVKRRQEVRGTTARGITVIDDFGHHPTAIREAIAGLRHRYPERRLWAVFEPRSNTTRRNVFQQDLPDALSLADAVCVSAVPDPEKFAPDQRLDPERVMADIRGRDIPAFYEADANAIVARLGIEARDCDVVVVFSNGGFDGIHDKLLAAL
ncbi:MAG: UDP-N-acetylmuramate:L-alanyl-gamma-D-glutamyl-meso-diaminopimelate ligase [Verrucomicrobiales bacterium]|nr:UDP-N-acetylmuramate:L-alanyl-gamma-D-glutamyl-meso-diaminopimelate ligase [Verrucomicrobiales bacterium]